MKLFDGLGKDEESSEVEIRPPQDSETGGEEKETRLGKQVEEELMGSESKTAGSTASMTDSTTGKTAGTQSSATGSVSGSGSSSASPDLPEMSSSSSSSTSSSSTSSSTSSTSRSSSGKIDIEDVHRQNKKIIGLLEDIKDEVGGSDELL